MLSAETQLYFHLSVVYSAAFGSDISSFTVPFFSPSFFFYISGTSCILFVPFSPWKVRRVAVQQGGKKDSERKRMIPVCSVCSVIKCVIRQKQQQQQQGIWKRCCLAVYVLLYIHSYCIYSTYCSTVYVCD